MSQRCDQVSLSVCGRQAQQVRGKKTKTLSLSEAVEAGACLSPKRVRPCFHRSCAFVARPKIKKKRASENANVSEEQRRHVKGTLKDGRSGEI